jgi:hypothetical protein
LRFSLANRGPHGSAPRKGKWIVDAESKHAVTEFLGKHLDAIAYATEVAWNLREWLRECKSALTLQAVLDSLLPRIRAELELKLIDSGLVSMTSGLPSNDLSAASLIAFVENLRFSHGTRIRLPHGDPPEKWITLSRYRAEIIARRMVDEHGNLLFDANKSSDLDKIESLDGYTLKGFWDAGEALDHDEPPTKANAPEPKSKRSTERGEGQAKLIAGLTKHHKYVDGGCLNFEPIGNNELARLVGVSGSTASAFFNKQFNGHTKYRANCADATLLVAALKLLNQEFSPHLLFGIKPPDEGEREDEE